jgi:hypothetical protein
VHHLRRDVPAETVIQPDVLERVRLGGQPQECGEGPRE